VWSWNWRRIISREEVLFICGIYLEYRQTEYELRKEARLPEREGWCK
jgi:hypothetical protein